VFFLLFSLGGVLGGGFWGVTVGGIQCYTKGKLGLTSSLWYYSSFFCV